MPQDATTSHLNPADSPHAELGERAIRLNPDAASICPWCLYRLEGSLSAGQERPCPECGEPVSEEFNLEEWGARARAAPLLRFVVFWWGGCVALWSVVVIGIALAFLKQPTGPVVQSIILSAPILVAATPFVTFGCCYRLLYLRRPTRAAGSRLVISIGVAVAHTAVACVVLLALLLAL
ncbi:hypothetical protein ABWH91_13890 [Phycisphaerales bacterium ac7]